jgi:tetratricopeptide (TPR) repeat protein
MSHQNEAAPPFQIGSTVRLSTKATIKSSEKHKMISRRGMIATLSDADDESKMCTIILENLVPAPLLGKFLIAPPLSCSDAEDFEIEVPTSEIQSLLPFEYCVAEDNMVHYSDSDVSRIKEYGDELFKLHDYTNAISYYEVALYLISSDMSNIGATLVVKRNGHCVIAELDCIESDGDNSQCDVTFILPNGTTEEDMISSNDILVSVWDKGAARRGQRDKPKETYLQLRILLNLSRCLLNLADIYTECTAAQSISNDQQAKCNKSAVLASSIAITLCEYCINISDSDSPILPCLLKKAQLIRSKAFFAVGKLPNALIDVKKVINNNPDNREATESLRDIETVERNKKRADKKLSKEVCRWVQSATGDL